MKPTLIKACALILAALTLSSCGAKTPQKESTTTISTSQNSADKEILTYYESAIADLEESIINMKEDFYISEQEYKSTIKSLEEKISVLTEKTPAEDYPIENISVSPFSYVISNGVATITSYSGTATKITIPSSIANNKVFKIGERALPSDINSIIISDGIEEIDWFAFSNCTSLQEIYIPASVKLIGYGAFDGCPKSLVIKCPASSYAEAYAKSFALNYIVE